MSSMLDRHPVERQARPTTWFTKGKSVNKSQLIDALSRHYEGNKRAAAHALESVLDTITPALRAGADESR